jgi:transcriptional regulator with XRE-family HTH domain
VDVDDVASRPPIGSKLRRMRKSLNLGAVEAAERAGFSPGFLSAIELSKANTSVATLPRLAAACGTTVLEFFDLPNKFRRLIHPSEGKVLRTDSCVDIELLSVGTRILERMLFWAASLGLEATAGIGPPAKNSPTC